MDHHYRGLVSIFVVVVGMFGPVAVHMWQDCIEEARHNLAVNVFVVAAEVVHNHDLGLARSGIQTDAHPVRPFALSSLGFVTPTCLIVGFHDFELLRIEGEEEGRTESPEQDGSFPNMSDWDSSCR